MSVGNSKHFSRNIVALRHETESAVGCSHESAEGLAAINYLRKGEGQFAKAILRAYGDFLGSKKVKSPAVVTNLPEVGGSGPVGVIFLYFLLLGKRKFTDL